MVREKGKEGKKKKKKKVECSGVLGREKVETKGGKIEGYVCGGEKKRGKKRKKKEGNMDEKKSKEIREK